VVEMSEDEDEEEEEEESKKAIPRSSQLLLTRLGTTLILTLRRKRPQTCLTTMLTIPSTPVIFPMKLA
jgi:hypothetical protein